jgi:hypothetical protein
VNSSQGIEFSEVVFLRAEHFDFRGILREGTEIEPFGRITKWLRCLFDPRLGLVWCCPIIEKPLTDFLPSGASHVHASAAHALSSAP